GNKSNLESILRRLDDPLLPADPQDIKMRLQGMMRRVLIGDGFGDESFLVKRLLETGTEVKDLDSGKLRELVPEIEPIFEVADKVDVKSKKVAQDTMDRAQEQQKKELIESRSQLGREIIDLLPDGKTLST